MNASSAAGAGAGAAEVEEVLGCLAALLDEIERGGSDSDRLAECHERSSRALARLQELAQNWDEEQRAPLRARVRDAARLNQIISSALDNERRRLRGELSKVRRASDLLRTRAAEGQLGGSCDVAG